MGFQLFFRGLMPGLSVLLLSSGCALLNPPEKDPLSVKVADLAARVTGIEQVVNGEGLVNLLNQMAVLQKEAGALREQLDQIQFKLEQSATAQKQQYLEADQRLKNLEKALDSRTSASPDGRSVLDGGPLQPGQLPVPNGNDRVNYQAAFELLKQGRYKEAGGALGQFMVAFPNSSLSDNAQYWLAETHYVSQSYEKALPAFTVVVEKYPQSRKIPDAFLKIGYCNYELKRYGAARKALQSVVTSYPETTAARLAGQRLERMTSEGL